MKTCKRCKTTREDDASTCVTCSRIASKAWKLRNRVAVRKQASIAAARRRARATKEQKDARTASQRAWTERNKDRLRNERKANWTAVAKRSRDLNLRRMYGLSQSKYDEMLAAQGGRCAICGTDSPGGRGNTFPVDHCHATGRVRGLLCTLCNVGMGGFHDDPMLLFVAMKYLERGGV